MNSEAYLHAIRSQGGNLDIWGPKRFFSRDNLRAPVWSVYRPINRMKYIFYFSCLSI